MSKLKNRFVKLDLPRPHNLRVDVLSGLTVALALVPEAIAFSFTAGVKPVVGLYAAFMVGLITSILGGRPGMISGATGAVAVIFAPMVKAQIKDVGYEGALGYLFAAVLLMGIIQMVFGVLKLGKFIRLVPHPVMLGFVNGLAIVICMAQFSQFKIGSGETAQWLTGANLAIMIGLVALTMIISWGLPKLTKAVPATLVAIVSVALLAMALSHFEVFHARTVLDFVKQTDPKVTTLAADLPSFALPNVPVEWATLKIIAIPAILAALVGLIESLMTMSLVDEITQTRGRGNRECLAQGLANVTNGFFGGMGGCAMIGQSMINIRGGGRGRTSGITAALCLLGFILYGASLIEAIPVAALVGVMFMVVIGTFEWSSLRILRHIPRSDAFVLILVSGVTVLIDLAVAVLVGIVVSALVFAWRKGSKMDATISLEKDTTKVYKLDGYLFFGSATSFKDLFDIAGDPEHVVIDFESSRVYDHSGLEAINSISERYKEAGKKLHLLNLSKECAELIDKNDAVVEVKIMDNLDWHLADNKLA
ncbi:MAG: SulP family inorganic anion transporter [Phycisphaerales bacterium]|mgnify:CR=1 FL=1|jgi:sulfate permease, SulP family|nr:SulP family inorganic anion transporter [Phycisphaerales bacterium]MBT7171822.1 SulP family inorganic anion transporter [Phycisphaerales bacterium]